MKITDIMKENKVTVSFEMFPPKTWAGIEETKNTAREMVALKPDFVSVTYGAGGNGGGFTNEVAKEIKKAGTEPLYHLTCITNTKEEIENQLGTLKEEGIENVLALRGDYPEGFDTSSPREFQHASDLVKEIKKCGNFCIGAACYPESHPESKNAVEDLFMLKEKVDCGVDFLVSQMFFDNELFYDFKERCSLVGINVPIVAGIMPITNISQINRSIQLSGCKFPKKFSKIITRFGENPAAMKQAGIVYALEQIVDLIANGQNDIHIYTMNKNDVAGGIMRGLSEILNG